MGCDLSFNGGGWQSSSGSSVGGCGLQSRFRWCGLVFGVLVPCSNGGGRLVFQGWCWIGVSMFILDLDCLLILVWMDLVAG